MRILFGTMAAAILLAGAAQAKDGAMVRVIECKGLDAAMEIYVSEDVLTGMESPHNGVVDGLYALDLFGAKKGKHLEHVHITQSPDHKGIVMTQYTRDLPPTMIPEAGGTVNFDNRFGSKAVCSKFSLQ